MQKRKKIGLLMVVAVSALLVTINLAFAEHSDNTTTNSGNVTSINLSGIDKNISWKTDGYSPNGFKIVWSKNEGPTYPCREGDKYHYYSDPNQSQDVLEPFNGSGIYYVRVCEYLGGKCGIYSNQIKVNLGDNSNQSGDSSSSNNSSQNVKAIYLENKGNNGIIWKVDGKSPQGFKVVWSKNESPTYPLRDGDQYHYSSDPSWNTDTLTPFNGAGIYYARVCEYLGGKCGVYSNQIKLNLEGEKKQNGTDYKKENEKVFCTMDYNPVCGVNGKTYSNECVAVSQNEVKIAYKGECKELIKEIKNKDEQIKKIEEKSSQLSQNQMDQILEELKQLRDLVKEQQNEIKYLKGLMTDMSKITSQMQNSLNNFITYGVDENTKKLGEGERAAVIHSYKEAYGNLPESEDDLTDVIKIANGRWPNKLSPEAEEAAKENFEIIYERAPNMDNPNDNAAVTIMAYGLRQKAENRNLNSEKNGIKIFKDIFGHVPQSTEEWNIMQAITYSGATK